MSVAMTETMTAGSGSRGETPNPAPARRCRSRGDHGQRDQAAPANFRRCLVPSFAFGLPVSELPLQVGLLELASLLALGRDGATRGWPGKVGVAAFAASLAGLAFVHRQADEAGPVLEDALVEALGSGYRDRIGESFRPREEVPLTRHRTARPGHEGPQALPHRSRRAVRGARKAELPRRVAEGRPPAGREGSGPGADPRRRMDDGKEGGAGGAAHGPPGGAGLGLRHRQLPALAPGDLAGPHRRREAGPGLDQGHDRPSTAATPASSPSPADPPAATSRRSPR